MHPGRIGTWPWRQVGYVFRQIQREKQGSLYCSSDWNSGSEVLSYSKQCGTRTFKNLPVELCFQRESAVGSWEDTENKFRAVHKLLLENHYDVMMVEAGAEKICTAHFDPCCQTHAQDWMLTSIESSILVCVLYICPFVISLRCLYMFIPCFPEILFLISCRLGSIVAYKKMLNRNLIVWKDWNPVCWTSNSQVSILNPAFNWKVWGFS